MKNKARIFLILIVSITFSSCVSKSATSILTNTINTIDTISTIYYKQDMIRNDPRNPENTINRYREMYFSRLITDSIVGVAGHWYMFINDNENVVYEDIYDGNKLLRISNRDSLIRIYDLEKFPEFKEKHFWSHNTPYGMQFEFKYFLNNPDIYNVIRLNDTLFNGVDCYQIEVKLENMTSMPGFAINPMESKGNNSRTYYFIDKYSYFPVGMRGEFYSSKDPNNISFIDQKYYDINFNMPISNDLINTSDSLIYGYKINLIKP
jgi:hypothetical protein